MRNRTRRHLAVVIPVLLVASALSHRVTHSLESLAPRTLRPNSTRGFHRHVYLHEPVPDRLHRYLPRVSRLLRRRRLLAPLPSIVRFHDVQLYGGMVAVGEYYARVQIGGQTVRVQIDTGSATLAVPVAECKNCKEGDMRYSLDKSNSGIATTIGCADDGCMANTCSPYACGGCSQKKACCANSDRDKCAFHLSFGDGSGAKGILVRDNLKWGDLEFPVTFGGIRSDSPDFERAEVDGILGMAYPTLACNPSCITPTFESMLEKYHMRDLFTICITYDSGRIVLGDFDPAMSSEDVSWVPLRQARTPDFYAFPLIGNLQVNGEDLPLPSYSRAIVDSGTTLIVFSHATFDKFKRHLQQHYCDVPGLCDQDSWFRPAHCTRISLDDRRKLPVLTFRVKDLDITLGPEEYLINYASKGSEFWCVGIMALDSMSGGVDVIFGNTVMKKYVTVYDRENHRVGFAVSDKNCAIAEAETDNDLPVEEPAEEPEPQSQSNDPVPVPAPAPAEEPPSEEPPRDTDSSSTTESAADSETNDPIVDNSPNLAESPGSICNAAANCTACAKVTDANCFWDSPIRKCVKGDATVLMCTVDALAGRILYVVGGAFVVVIVVVAAIVFAVKGYRKRNAALPADPDEHREATRPLAPHERDTHAAFAIDDEE